MKPSKRYLGKVIRTGFHADIISKDEVINYGKLVAAETELKIREELHKQYPRIQVTPCKEKLEQLKKKLKLI